LSLIRRGILYDKKNTVLLYISINKTSYLLKYKKNYVDKYIIINIIDYFTIENGIQKIIKKNEIRIEWMNELGNCVD
jgi:hypothetical protein